MSSVFDIIDEFSAQTIGTYDPTTSWDEWKTNYINGVRLIPIRENYNEFVLYLNIIKEYDGGEFNDWHIPQRVFEKAYYYMLCNALGGLTYEDLLEWVNDNNPSLTTQYLVEAQEEERRTDYTDEEEETEEEDSDEEDSDEE